MQGDKRERFRLTMRQKVIRFRAEKWWWWVFIAIAWGTHWIYAIALCNTLAIYSLAITNGAAEQGAEAARQASDEPS